MSVNLSLLAGAGWQFFTDDGVPLAGGLLYTYAAGTTTPQATYTSSSGLIAHANPIVLNSAGRVATGEVWLTNGYSYKFLLKDASNVQIASYDNIPGTSSNLPIINDASSVAYEQGFTVTAGSFVVGNIYLITSIGTTNFTSIGASANTVGFYFTATGAGSGTGTAQLSRTVQAKLQESVSVKDFGAVGDGVTDDYQSIRNALDSLPSLGGSLLFPATASGGVYYLSQGLIINRPVRMIGQVVSANTTSFYNGTVLKFAASTTGITFNSYNSTGGELAYGANYSVIENIAVASAGGSGAFDGILIRAPGIKLKNVWTFSFPRNGIRIRAQIGGGTDLEGNGNLWSLEDISSQLNGSDGLYVEGLDANAGSGTNVNCSNNGGYGIYDSSFLGNSYFGCHVDNNTLGAYKTDGANAQTVFSGCYTEPTQGAKSLSSLVSPTVFIGGLGSSEANISTASTAFVLGGGGAYRKPFTYTNSSGTVSIGANLGANDTSMSCFTWGTVVETATYDAWKLKFNNTSKCWTVQFANSASYEPLSFFNSLSARTAVGTGPLIGGNNSGYYVGTAAAPVLRGFASAAPVAGAYVVGDIIYNNAPVAGGTIGFVCTTAGTPGTWKTFGAISA